MKKKLRFLLPLCMAAVMSASAMTPVSAGISDKPCLSLKSGYAGENDIFYVDAVLSGGIKAAAYSITLGFDPSKLEFVSAENEIKGGSFYYNDRTEDCVTFVWSGNKDIDLKDDIIKMTFKARGRTAGETAPISFGHCVVGTSDMSELPLDTEDCEINIKKNYKYGDANCDGFTNFADVVCINKLRVCSSYSPDEDGLINSDTDKNNIVDERDSKNVFAYVSANTEGGI